MKPAFAPDRLRLKWDQTEEVARGVLREGPLMPLSALALGAVGAYYDSLLAGVLWGAMLLATSSILIATCRRFTRLQFSPEGTRASTRAVYLASLLQACAAGSHMLIFWTPGRDDINVVLLVIFMASAMLAVSLTAASGQMLVTKLVLHAVVAQIVMIADGSPSFTVLAILSPFYFIALAGSGYRTYQRSAEVLVLAQQRDAVIVDLRRANEAKSIFLANMSHELRTPLNAIIGFSEVMKSEMFGPHGSPKYLDYSGDIHASGSHLLDLINDILDGARVDAGSYVPADDTFAAVTLFDECARLIAGRIDEKRILFSCKVEGGLTFRADHRGMKQVVINLLANAVKFTPPGGSVTLEAWREVDGRATIAVSDNGPGIEARDMARIFESFGQARHDVAAKDRGVGLGLAIVKGILVAHGGGIDVKSQPGEGTTMSARLPAARIVALKQPEPLAA